MLYAIKLARHWFAPWPRRRATATAVQWLAMLALLLLLASTDARPLTLRRKMVQKSPACPGSPASRHSQCSLKVDFDQSCVQVAAEIVARLRGEQGWRCPKSHPGSYELISESAAAVQGRRTTGAGATPPGPGKSYTDAFGFQLAASASGGGTGHTCSESQGPSFCDYSTNYCNMRNLYCNTAEGCKVVHHELTSKEEVDASCYHAPKCQGSLKGYETNKEMCKR